MRRRCVPPWGPVTWLVPLHPVPEQKGRWLHEIGRLGQTASRPARNLLKAARERESKDMARVLVVEDEPDIRSVVGKLLQGAGYAVALACDGVAALEHVRLAPPDCVLLDMHMPGMDGPSFLAAWRAERGYRKVPVVLFTSAVDGVKAAAALQVQACISKPFDLDAVLDTIARVLGAPEAGPGQAAIEGVDSIDHTTDAFERPASLASVPARIVALRERALRTRQTIARNRRTMLWAERYLDGTWTQPNS